MTISTAANPTAIRSSDSHLTEVINLRLALLNQPGVLLENGEFIPPWAGPLLARHRETARLLAHYLCPADWRIQNFLNDYFYGTGIEPSLPNQTFILDSVGLARAMSLPPHKDDFTSSIGQSYRLRQGVLHNPASDRRTTQGVFHIAEGGLPIPDDKLSVPIAVAATLLRHAFTPPRELLRLPFSDGQETQAECFVSLLMRPLVCPEVLGITPKKSMEIRFFAPGNLVSNLDFVESIFDNAGDPHLPENDSALDVEHWTGHTGCVVLAPHLTKLTKQALGLPSYDHATERQRRDSMCWTKDGELYNNGSPFKLTCRDQRGVMVTIIADNYYGYCKKEVKTQISYAANLFGSVEEEHSGGALVYASYDLGEEFSGNYHVRQRGHAFDEVVSAYGACMELQSEGYAVDKKFPEINYVPENADFDLKTQTVSWPGIDGKRRQIKLLCDKIYVRPSGYNVRMEKPPGNRAWRLVGTVAEPTLCHKPSTVSGGGKSEISKSIEDAILQGPIFVADFKKDFNLVSRVIRRDYSDRFNDLSKNGADTRPILSPERSLGSVIKLLTPSEDEYSPEFNLWLNSIPQYIKEQVFVVKRFYKTEWGLNWRDRFSVDIINGTPGNELKLENRKLISNFLRVGYDQDGAWRVFGLRKDFHPAAKIQSEDDITASVVVPSDKLAHLNPDYSQLSVKFVQNCELRLFQRPDDAVHRGYDKQAEHDLTQPGNFLSNFEPLTQINAQELKEDALGFVKYTPPMQALILDAAKGGRPTYFVSSAHPRLVEGKPSKNPRYLQTRPDLLMPREVYLAEMAIRLQRRIPAGLPVYTPVNAVVPGRRNNGPEPAAGIRALAVYNPVHYMEIPELFMEFICSMTGKSPSTTGAGSEGALTKGPFNALPGIVDLNQALVSNILTGADAFISAAGVVGPKARVEHDISLLIPEVWCRMSVAERNPQFLISHGYFEKCPDLQHQGRIVQASRLGYRMTSKFVRAFFGRVFNHPHVVFTEEMLRPELQDFEVFAEGMENVITTQQRVAQSFFDDRTIELACPPLRALLQIMVTGDYEGKGIEHPEIRELFTLNYLLASPWYRDRLKAKQDVDIQLWLQHVTYLEHFLTKSSYASEANRLGIQQRLEIARQHYKLCQTAEYLEGLHGTIGVQKWPQT